MIREITKDTNVLQTVSSKAKPKSKETKQVVQDLIDTAEEYKEQCIGLAAIQIAEPTRILVAFNGENFIPFINPVITQYLGEKYEVEEGCMSLEGKRKVKRSRGVEIMHQKGNKFVKEKYGGLFAEILQHEIDHLNGVLFIDHIKDDPEAWFYIDDKDGELKPVKDFSEIENNKDLWPDD